MLILPLTRMVGLTKFMMKPTISVQRGSTHLWYSESTQ